LNTYHTTHQLFYVDCGMVEGKRCNARSKYQLYTCLHIGNINGYCFEGT